MTQCSNDRGSLVIGAIMALLVLSSVGLMISLTVAEDVQIAKNHIESLRCLYIAESGLYFAAAKLDVDINWSGVTAPGVAVGFGEFTVVVADTLADGTPLASGGRRLNIKGRVNSAEREIEVLLQ